MDYYFGAIIGAYATVVCRDPGCVCKKRGRVINECGAYAKLLNDSCDISYCDVTQLIDVKASIKVKDMTLEQLRKAAEDRCRKELNDSGIWDIKCIVCLRSVHSMRSGCFTFVYKSDGIENKHDVQMDYDEVIDVTDWGKKGI